MNSLISSSNILSTNHLKAVEKNTDFPMIHGTKLDPITAQIMKNEDAALKLMHLIENGNAGFAWNEEKKIPAVTWLGDCMDRLFGWGQYYKHNTEITSEIARKALNLQKSNAAINANCSNDFYVVGINVSTAFDVRSYPNGTCEFMNPEDYVGRVWEVSYNSPKNYDKLICYLRSCVKEALIQCAPTCLPCKEANSSERKNYSNYYEEFLRFDSQCVPNMTWALMVHGNEPLNIWKSQNFMDFMKNTIHSCEIDLIELNSEIGVGISRTILFPPIILGGIVLYLICKNRTPSETTYTEVT